MGQLQGWGFDAFSGYNYHNAFNYPALATNTQNEWQNALANSALPYWPSAITGGDGTAWEYWDEGAPTLTQFEAHLAAAETFIANNQQRTQMTMMVCCWNEWGEGEFMQPSDFTFDLVQRGSALADVHRNMIIWHSGAVNYQPFGWFDAIDASGVAWGWAIDMDTPNSRIIVHFYVDNSYDNGGTYIGGDFTNVLRGDINQTYNIVGTHGFAWQIPAQYRGRRIYIHTINSSANGLNPLLGGSYRVWQ